jgi:hypothetical protein
MKDNARLQDEVEVFSALESQESRALKERIRDAHKAVMLQE